MLHAHWVTQSQAVIYGRAAVKAIILTSDGTGAADVTLYEGRDDAGKVILVLRTPTNYSYQVTFDGGFPIQDGLYVKLGSNVAGVLVVWEPLE